MDPGEPDPVDVFYLEVGRQLRRARDRGQVTQDDLGRRVGLTRTSIANIEAGRQRMPLHVFVAIANSLDIDPRLLLNPDVLSSAGGLHGYLERHLAEAPATAREFVADAIAQLEDAQTRDDRK